MKQNRQKINKWWRIFDTACVERHDPLQLYPKSENSYSKCSKLKLHVSLPGWPEKNHSQTTWSGKRQEIWDGQGTTYFVGCIKGLHKWTKPRGCIGKDLSYTNGDKESEIFLYTNEINGQKKTCPKQPRREKKTGNLGRERHSLLGWLHKRFAQVNKT